MSAPHLGLRYLLAYHLRTNVLAPADDEHQQDENSAIQGAGLVHMSIAHS